MEVGCVLMASGFGARFGSNKLLAEAGGVPLIRRALDLYRQTAFARRAVVSQYPEILSLGESLGFLPVYNPSADQGISASVRLGTAALSDMDALLFGVCDQPWLTAESVARLLETFRAHPEDICSLARQGRRGESRRLPSGLFPGASRPFGGHRRRAGHEAPPRPGASGGGFGPQGAGRYRPPGGPAALTAPVHFLSKIPADAGLPPASAGILPQLFL